jgi:hypothetical protein
MAHARFAFAVSGCLALAGIALFTGCHATNNGGGALAYTGGPQTVASTETLQKTVRMIDTRSGEVFFAIDIPPGMQLTYDFDRDEGDDAVYTPDIMRYEVKKIGDKSGRLGSAQTVPNAASRRVEVDVKQGTLYSNESPESAALRTDSPADRPDWWTARGGALPDQKSHTVYDN